MLPDGFFVQFFPAGHETKAIDGIGHHVTTAVRYLGF